MNTLPTPLANFHARTPEERQVALDALIQARKQPLNGEVDKLNRQISEIESRLNMTAEEITAACDSGQETQETCRWMILTELRDRVSAT